MKKVLLSLILAAVTLPAAARPRELHIVTTGDVHGTFFNRSYIDGQPGRNSLMSVKYYVDGVAKTVSLVSGSNKTRTPDLVLRYEIKTLQFTGTGVVDIDFNGGTL